MSSKQERRKKRLKKKSFTKLRDSREAIPTTSDLGVLGVGSSVLGSYAVLCTTLFQSDFASGRVSTSEIELECVRVQQQ